MKKLFGPLAFLTSFPHFLSNQTYQASLSVCLKSSTNLTSPEDKGHQFKLAQSFLDAIF
jgi:hypothetical protein